MMLVECQTQNRLAAVRFSFPIRTWPSTTRFARMLDEYPLFKKTKNSIAAVLGSLTNQNVVETNVTLNSIVYSMQRFTLPKLNPVHDAISNL